MGEVVNSSEALNTAATVLVNVCTTSESINASMRNPFVLFSLPQLIKTPVFWTVRFID